MRHLGPGASQQAGSLPPRMFPRGIPSAALPDAVTSTLRHAAPAPARSQARYHSQAPATSTPHGQAGSGSRPPGSAPLHRRPPRRPPPAAKKLRAPACGIVFRASHHASGPQEFPSRRTGNCASRTSFVSSTSHARAATSERYGVKCCPRHSRHFRVRASLVQLGHSCGIT
jgi:hypothetical protein